MGEATRSWSLLSLSYYLVVRLVLHALVVVGEVGQASNPSPQEDLASTSLSLSSTSSSSSSSPRTSSSSKSSKSQDADAERRATIPTESRLKHHLERRFDFLTQQSKPRPVRDVSRPVVVTFEIHVIQILDFTQKEQKLTTQLWMQFKWKDEFISWNPDRFDGISKIQLNSDLIWRPDIILYNNYGGDQDAQDDVQLVLSSNGDVLWMPPTILHSSCQVNLTNFPFDIQRCTLEFGSWIYSVKELDIESKINGSLKSFLNMKSYVPNMEWEIDHVETIKREILYECCEDPYVLVTFTFVLRRNSGYYARVMLLPVLLLSVIAVFIFCVPAHRPDRTSLGLSLFTSFMLLLLLVVDISPPSVASKLSTYLSACVGIVTSAIVISILLINISTWSGEVPAWIGVIFLDNLSRCLFPFTHRTRKRQRRKHAQSKQNNDVGCDVTRALQTEASIESNGGRERVDVQLQRPRAHSSEWCLVVNVLDRLLFLIYTVILAVCVGLYFPCPPL